MSYNNDYKTSFPELVMDQIKIIQKICSSELRDGDKVLKNAMGEQIIEGEDTRYSFLQSVEVLGSMLSPYFGKQETGFDEFCNYYDTELIEIFDNEEFKEKLKQIFGTTPEKAKGSEELLAKINIFFLNDKIKEGRKMFRKLIAIFKNNGFLKEEAYGDTSGASGASLDATDDAEEDVLA